MGRGTRQHTTTSLDALLDEQATATQPRWTRPRTREARPAAAANERRARRNALHSVGFLHERRHDNGYVQSRAEGVARIIMLLMLAEASRRLEMGDAEGILTRLREQDPDWQRQIIPYIARALRHEAVEESMTAELLLQKAHQEGLDRLAGFCAQMIIDDGPQHHLQRECNRSLGEVGAAAHDPELWKSYLQLTWDGDPEPELLDEMISSR